MLLRGKIVGNQGGKPSQTGTQAVMDVCCSLDRLADGSPGGKRGSGKTGKKARHSVDNGQMEPPDLNSSMSLR